MIIICCKKGFMVLMVIIPFMFLALFSLIEGVMEGKPEKRIKNMEEVYWPVHKKYGLSYISSPYGYRYDPFTGSMDFHYGIDIALDFGEDVYSIAKGRVIQVSDNYPGFGTLLIIEHEDFRGEGVTIRSLYGHCQQIMLEENQDVLSGERIATIGSRGRSTGPHLHFEIHLYNEDEKRWIAVDPMDYLKPPNQCM